MTCTDLMCGNDAVVVVHWTGGNAGKYPMCERHAHGLLKLSRDMGWPVPRTTPIEEHPLCACGHSAELHETPGVEDPTRTHLIQCHAPRCPCEEYCP